MKKAIAIGSVLLLVIFSFWLFSSGKRQNESKYKFEALDRGDITATVTATGTLSAVTTVQVGSQVSGIISQLYVDFNSKVNKGQLLAELDPTPFQTQVDQRRADLERARVEERNARIAFDRAKKLLESDLLSPSEFDTAVANLDSAHASVKQLEAALRQTVTNLSYTKIHSPIDGVVVERQCDIGQTVAASFQAPTLFTIAQDLRSMQVSTNIDEADIGRIQTGKKARFTVDAFPDRTFEGEISQIRLSPQVVQNVVTYPVLIDVYNPELLLKPGMTANVQIPVETESAVLKVPNAALRFQPDPADLAETPPSEASSGGRDNRPKKGPVVYVPREDGKLASIPVRTGITDGNYTSIVSDRLKEGDQIVVSLQTTRAMESTGGFGRSGRRRF